MNLLEILIPLAICAVPIYWGYLVVERLGENGRLLRQVADDMSALRKAIERRAIDE